MGMLARSEAAGRSRKNVGGGRSDVVRGGVVEVGETTVG